MGSIKNLIPSKDLIQLSLLKRTHSQIIAGPSFRPPGAFRSFQKAIFDPLTDSDCEDGRGPKRKQVRIENSDGSMPATGLNQDSNEENSMEVNVK